MTTAKKCVVWLEDNPHEDSLLALSNYIEKKQDQGVYLRSATGIMQLRRHLDEAKAEEEIVCGIILDIIVHGMTNLSSFERSDIRWGKGTADAGNKLIKYVFRSHKDNPWGYLSDVPILVLSVKVDISESEFKEFGDNIRVVQKYEDDDWELEVKAWVEKVVKS
ncbi:hypothetical protein [Candidatus Thiothrix anitrata]|uniref:Uncharacterized protein n=1 Tax=Candidatus Thiothrix anitrata TaxID=2823902 RepID=A0ABX7X5V3_9GAMM|nr:hypothetical protein [Candidatus Thiothrix anitrata]QTR51244.1 hypothetical protein J8380_06760 [Candidatus Thiothrix anitrata]